MKNINPLGLFCDHFIKEKLTKIRYPLQKPNEFINWEIFGFAENNIHPVKSNNVEAKQFNRVNGSIVRTIGIARPKVKIGMIYPVI